MRDGSAKPSSRAAAARSSGSDEPASADEPSGQKRAASRATRAKRAAARTKPCAAPSSQNASDTGCAGCQCVVAASSVPSSSAPRRAVFERARDAEREPRAACRAIARVEQQRGRDLIVAAAAGVQRCAGVGREFAHARVDRAVHVFERAGARERDERAVGDLFGDDVERGAQFARGDAREQPAFGERGDVRARTAHVERREHEIVFERGAEGDQRGIGSDGKPSSPLQRRLALRYAIAMTR